MTKLGFQLPGVLGTMSQIRVDIPDVNQVRSGGCWDRK